MSFLPINIVRRIVSYINNLSPQDHAGLYNIIENIIEKVIPLWNATLNPLRNSDFPRRIEYDAMDYGDLDDYTTKNGLKRLYHENKYDFWDRQENWKTPRKIDFIVRPNPPPFVRPKKRVTEGRKGLVRGNVDLKAEYRATGLQIIVKLSNIHLTPEKPEYGGGTWRVEGQLVRVMVPLHVLRLIFRHYRTNISAPPPYTTTTTRTSPPAT